MEETGLVKTDLGKRNFKVTRPDGECSKILVSNPEKTLPYYSNKICPWRREEGAE